MKDEIAAPHRLLDTSRIKEIALNKPKIRASGGALEEASLARGEIVICDNIVPLGKQRVDKVTSDEAGCAGYEDQKSPPSVKFSFKSRQRKVEPRISEYCREDDRQSERNRRVEMSEIKKQVE
jgi:hypothetical protein